MSENATKEAVHEVWVRRVVVIEEEICIAVGIREDEGVARSPMRWSRETARRKIIEERALRRAALLIEDGTWSTLNHNKTVIAEGPPLVTHVSGDVMRNDPSD